MFSTGTQRKYWLFKNEDELHNLRYEANVRYIESHKNQYSRWVSLRRKEVKAIS